jgi:hypothetical protein
VFGDLTGRELETKTNQFGPPTMNGGGAALRGSMRLVNHGGRKVAAGELQVERRRGYELLL